MKSFLLALSMACTAARVLSADVPLRQEIPMDGTVVTVLTYFLSPVHGDVPESIAPAAFQTFGLIVHIAAATSPETEYLVKAMVETHSGATLFLSGESTHSSDGVSINAVLSHTGGDWVVRVISLKVKASITHTIK